MSIFKRKRRKAAVAQAVQVAGKNSTQIMAAGDVSVIKSVSTHRPSQGASVHRASTARKPASGTYGHFSHLHTPYVASSLLSQSLIDSGSSYSSSSYSSCDTGSSFSSSDSGCSF